VNVRSIKRVRNLNAQIQNRFDLQWLSGYEVLESLTLKQFHGDEGSPIRVVDFVDGADVRVVQRRRSLGLPLKTAEGLCVVGEFFGKELQGHMATELEVFRLIHHAHAPTADFAEYAVVGNRLPHGLGRRGHWLAMLGGTEGKVKPSRGVIEKLPCERVVLHAKIVG